ncbi:MAG TPA: class I SAM-dependent methyltransferase [Blastocatellia bacterium]|nr:class I SAM-dependent methyltransferase [Blastocatellia bacterium]
MRRTTEVASKEYFEYLRASFLPEFCIRLGRRWFFRPLARVFRGRVLDIGCGIGHFLSVYAHALGLDVNPHCARYCREQGFKVIRGDASLLPFLNASFDGVLLSHILEHLEDPSVTLGEAVRVLKSGGILYIRVPTATGYLIDRTHKTYLTYPSLRDMLRRLDCSVLKHRYYPIPWKALGEVIVYNELRIIARKSDGRERADNVRGEGGVLPVEEPIIVDRARNK